MMRIRQYIIYLVFSACLFLLCFDTGHAEEPVTPINANLEVLDCRPNYRVGEVIQFKIKNISAGIVEGQLNIEWNLEGKWYRTTPYLGATEITKASKIETFAPNESKLFKINEKNMPDIYHTKPADYRIIFISMVDLGKQPPYPILIVGKFTVIDNKAQLPPVEK